MRIKILESVSGPNYSYVPGDVVEIDDERDAAAMLRAGIGVCVDELPQIETAAVEAPERAAPKGGRKRKAVGR